MCPSCKKTTLIQFGDHKICGSCWVLCTNDGTAIFNTALTPADERPHLPDNTPVKDIVFDYTIDNGGTAIYTSRVFCPKETVEETPFDAQNPTFKFFMKVHRKRFKNRRRYMYEKQRKMAESASN